VQVAVDAAVVVVVARARRERGFAFSATAPAVVAVVAGTGAAAALSGAVRTAGGGRRLTWVGIGLAGGLIAAVVMAVAA